ncbi:hypothetical protein QBC38DRAFT_138731 [Podospora fimiseda]|uniref:Uncharacterized protein n=1 Tax=Podospora fimiseda TaxID=252190 RepID=A0AAN7BF69_9PEZI|nr:hypothetical protein QBC38DRAFT_138731 [Podospora fimiseda]
MDVAYNQHSSAFRRKSRSSANLNHLSLAPLTSKLPIRDQDDYDVNPLSAPAHTAPYSYLEGKSVPTTPRLLSRSPGPSGSANTGKRVKRNASVPGLREGADGARIPKSKSAVHLRSPTSARRSTHHHSHHHKTSSSDRTDSDWLLRCGALISTETRESKGQAWLVSRASSTSLAGNNALDEDEAFERELARERQHNSRRASRRNSVHTNNNNNYPIDDDNLSSPAYSRFGSRSHSRVGSMTTGRITTFAEDYFSPNNGSGRRSSADDNQTEEEDLSGPDFVNLDDKLENLDLDGVVTDGLDDEVYVRRLVKGGNGGVGAWIGNMLGVKLFAVEEDEEETSEYDDDDDDGEEGEEYEEGIELDESKRVSSLRRLQNAAMATVDTASIPPPKADEGGWHDAAWLLTVASKVLL